MALDSTAKLAFDVGNVSARDISSVLDEPVHSLLEARELLDNGRLQNQGGVERHETDHGSDRNLLSVSEAPSDSIVVEAVFFVPERQVLIVTGLICHGIRNEQEVFEELGCDVLISGVVLGKLKSDTQPDE